MMKRVVLSGDTVPRESVDISPKYAGRLEKVYVDLGDKVTKGISLFPRTRRTSAIPLPRTGPAAKRRRQMQWKAGLPMMQVP